MTTTPSRRYGAITSEIRDVAVQTVVRALEQGQSLNASCRAVAAQLNVHTNTVRNWVRASADYPEVERQITAELARRIAELETVTALNRRLLHRAGQEGQNR